MTASRTYCRPPWPTAPPESELRLLLLALGDARHRAEEGKVCLGYALLLRGMLRAERAVIQGEVWAGELMRYWREALDDYCERYGDTERGE